MEPGRIVKSGVSVVAVAGAMAAIAIAVRAGHEMPVYPSYYPQEIRIEPMAPAAAAEALKKTRIQAFVGAMPPPGSEAAAVRAVEILGGYLVARVNPASPSAKDTGARCAVATQAIAALAAGDRDFRLHPYPVTPFHADYFHHADLAAAATGRLPRPVAGAGGFRVRVDGALAERVFGRPSAPAAGDWDVVLEEISLDRLLGPHRLDVNGWSGPPWLKQGWFHAYLLLADGVVDADARSRMQALFGRLKRDDHDTAEERINLERDLVGLLTADCRRVVAGYSVRRHYYTAEYSNGVENIAYDSQTGFDSAIFTRTVKLKDFPWNGWLTLGVEGQPTAAWNPIGGFTDPAGRLVWHALGDPAFFPEPYAEGWSMNRIGDIKRPPK
jgi:hypothetical protein